MSSSDSPASRDACADKTGGQLLEACRTGNVEAVTALLDAGADPVHADDSGMTPLMAAAENGNTAIISALLDAGAPWHAQDNDGYTAGEYASKNRGAFQLLLDWAVRAELILGSISHRQRDRSTPINAEYLSQSLRYTEQNKLIDADGEAVMMGWESPLMERHADILFSGGKQGKERGLDILNVGFGLGIVDTEIERRKPRTHTIIEGHKDVYKHMCDAGWNTRPGVNVVFGRWQDVIDQLGPFDGIFFDTYAEYYDDMREFHAQLPRLLRPGGVYSFFMGLAPDNWFFHLVYGEIARRELNALGLSVKYDAVSIDASADKIWRGVANRYWHLPVYFLPTCVMQDVSSNLGDIGDAPDITVTTRNSGPEKTLVDRTADA